MCAELVPLYKNHHTLPFTLYTRVPIPMVMYSHIIIIMIIITDERASMTRSKVSAFTIIIHVGTVYYIRRRPPKTSMS